MASSASDLPHGRIERRMSHAALTGGEIIAAGALGACLIACLATYSHATTGEWNTCLARGGQQMFGSSCHRRYFGFMALSFLLFSGTAFFLVRGRKRIGDTLRKPGPSLVIETDWFWCDQLAEPILFADVRQTREQKFRWTLSCLALDLAKTVRLVYADARNKLKSGDQPTFVFDAFGYADRVRLLETIAARIRTAAARKGAANAP